jgi:D-beta-D-heptose 7-phosphate kinase/D-beta-D-heptose 1-phosphate adenosyltransferase
MLDLLEKLQGTRILVVGDVNLDTRIIGEAVGLSPEAPVPRLEIGVEERLLGGAANIVENIRALGGEARLFTVSGDDPEGEYLARELEKRNVWSSIIRESGRITTHVTRILTKEGYQLLRIEKAEVGEVNQKTVNEVLQSAKGSIDWCQAVLVADFARGLVTKGLMSGLVQLAHEKGKRVVVNAARQHILYYEDADAIRINRREASLFAGVSTINETSLRIIGQKILSSAKCRAVVLTWIEEGIHIFEREKLTFIPPVIKRPLDVTGCGNTITSVIALGLAAGAGLEDSVRLANFAGAIVANKMGLATASLSELREAIERGKVE